MCGVIDSNAIFFKSIYCWLWKCQLWHFYENWLSHTTSQMLTQWHGNKRTIVLYHQSHKLFHSSAQEFTVDTFIHQTFKYPEESSVKSHDLCRQLTSQFVEVTSSSPSPSNESWPSIWRSRLWIRHSQRTSSSSNPVTNVYHSS